MASPVTLIAALVAAIAVILFCIIVLKLNAAIGMVVACILMGWPAAWTCSPLRPPSLRDSEA